MPDWSIWAVLPRNSALKKCLRERLRYNGALADYQVADVIMMLMMGVLAGVKHMANIIILKNDEVLRALFRWDISPDTTTFGRVF